MNLRSLFTKKKSVGVPNLQPEFFSIDTAINSSVKSVTTEPYAYHVWTHKCVSVIGQNVSQLPKLLQEKSTGSTKEDHVVLTLLAKPNTIMTQVPFFRMILSYLLLPTIRGGVSSGGQCFVIPWDTTRDSKVSLGKGELPDELFPYSDEYFEPWFGEEKHGRKQLRGWKFCINGAPGTEIYFEHGEIIRVNLLNPYNVLKGMSPYSPVASAVEFDAQADFYNKENFENNGRLDGMVSTDAIIDPGELQAMKKKWLEAYTGSQRDRVAFLMGGLKYQQFASSAAEMQYIDQEKWTRQKVLGGYGLNRIGVGDYEDINYATIREGRKILWYDTYIPMDKILLDAFTNQWVKNIEQGKYVLTSDYTKVPALQSDIQDRAKTGGMLVTQMRYPPSLASRIVELPLRQEDIIKWPHLDQAPPVQTTSPAPALSIKTKSYSDDYIARVLDPGEKMFKKDIERYFVAQRNSILDTVDTWERSHKSKANILPVVNAWEFLPDEVQENLDLLKIYRPSVRNQALLEKKQVESELGRGIEWDVNDQRMQYWVGGRSVYLEDINTNTFNIARDAIDATVHQAIADGKTVTELARNIKQAVHDVYEIRLGRPVVPNGLFDLGGMSSSATIARTEMGTIASLARYDMFREEGIEEIQWVTAGDERVRESHIAVNGETTQLGDPFSNGLRYPRDPIGDAGEVINCRCAYLAVTEQ